MQPGTWSKADEQGGSVRVAGWQGGERFRVLIQSGFGGGTGDRLPSELEERSKNRVSILEPVRSRARQSMPELKWARQTQPRAQRAVQRRAQRRAQRRVSSRSKATNSLRLAISHAEPATRKLANGIASEAFLASTDTMVRPKALCRQKQEMESEADLQEALVGFFAVCKKVARKNRRHKAGSKCKTCHGAGCQCCQ